MRCNKKQIKVGNVIIGGSNHVVIQSMTNTKTSNIDETIRQIKKQQMVPVIFPDRTGRRLI